MWFTITFFTLLAVTSFKDANGSHVETNTRHIEGLPGDTIIYKCKISQPLIYCRMEIPGFSEAVILAPSKNQPGARVLYEGDGFDKGHCGVKLSNIDERNNGQIKCTLGGQDYTESSQNATLTVARAPSPPELKFLPPIQSADIFKEGDVVSLKCTASKGRPVANLTWFIGNDLVTEGLSSPVKSREENDFWTISQNLTRTLQASDSGKELKCVAGHIALHSPNNQKTTLLRVQFAPKPWERPHEQLGLVEGQEGRVVVSVQSNPRPTFVWKVGEDSIYEGSTDNENKYEVLRGYNKGGDIWASILKINNLSQDDIKKTYWLKATNTRGERDYEIYISTNTEPRSAVGAKTIIFLFVAIVIVSIVALAVFARARGLWCFAGDVLMSGIRQIESSDTESMNHRPGADDKGKKDNKPKISVKAIFKKKWDQKPPEANKPSSNGVGDADPEAQKPETPNVTLVSEEMPKETQKKGNDNIVYAELTLPASSSPVTRPRVDDKTEYAEIIHS